MVPGSQGQEAAVTRASQRLNDARAKFAETQSDRKKLATDIKQHEDFMSHTENLPAQRKEIEDVLPQLKTKLELLENEEHQRQTREIEAEQQLRTEEVRLSELHDELDRLDKALENASRRSGGSPQ